MRAEEFVQRLQAVMPSRECLQDYGLDEDEIEDVQSTFIAVRRNVGQAKEALSSSEIERLFELFDCTQVEIGLIRFGNRPTNHDNGICFAECEADLLVLNHDGRIVLYDHDHGADEGLPCAVNASYFLDALAEFLTIRHDKQIWKGRVLEAASKCAHVAGGTEYQKFYELLCAFLR
jgi:hypothetical protein